MSLKMEHFKKRLCCVVYQWLYCLPRANVALHIFVNVNQKMFMLQINRHCIVAIMVSLFICWQTA